MVAQRWERIKCTEQGTFTTLKMVSFVLCAFTSIFFNGQKTSAAYKGDIQVAGKHIKCALSHYLLENWKWKPL